MDSAEYAHLREALGSSTSTMQRLVRARDVRRARLGFRCGFLGLLHMEIIPERLEREYNLELITTAPSVVYKLYMKRRRDARDAQPRQYAERTLETIEDLIKATVIVPSEYLGGVVELCQERRGKQRISPTPAIAPCSSMSYR